MVVMAKEISTSVVVDEIRYALESSGQTRYAIHKASGVDQAALCRFTGGASLRIESLEKIAQALGLEIRVVKVKKPKGRK